MRTVSLPRSSLKKEVSDIFSFLLAVNQEQETKSVLRVAGGWVRDTLLGIPSNDIDIAIETVDTGSSAPLITGEVFTSWIAKYQAANALPTNTISVIKTNPEKSKHIETAQMTVMGIPLEFCHLRHDDYTSDSRVPSVRPGTPLEDALRRDYTVNALFYNLHTEMVEDFTTGLKDIEDRILRTPLAPRETFLDDPLRLLRGIRFSGQLGYALAEEVVACAHDPTLVAMMREKVSRERIGIEFGKMMGGNTPNYCSDLLQRTRLLHNTILQEVYFKKGKGKSHLTNEIEFTRPLLPVHANPEVIDEVCAGQQTWGVAYLKFIIDTLEVPKGSDRIIVSLLALLMPLVLKGLLTDVSASYDGGPAATLPERIVALVMSGLKQPTVVSDSVTRVLQATTLLLHQGGNDLLQALRDQQHSASSSSIFASGQARELFFDALCILSTKTMLDCAPLLTLTLFLLSVGVEASEIVALQNGLRQDKNLMGSVTCVIPLRGDDVSATLGIEKKKTATYLMAQRRYCLHNPLATRDEVISFLKTLEL